MFHRPFSLVALAALPLVIASAPALATSYDFSTVNGDSTPTTLNGATFTSATSGGAFTFGPNAGLYSNLGPYVLAETSGIGATLQISFAQAQTGISFDAATSDLLALNGSDSVTVNEYSGTTLVGTQSIVPVIPASSGDSYPQGLFNLTSSGPFTSVTISAADSAGAESLVIADLATTPVPLPASLWLLGSSLAGLGWRMRRKAA